MEPQQLDTAPGQLALVNYSDYGIIVTHAGMRITNCCLLTSPLTGAAQNTMTPEYF